MILRYVLQLGAAGLSLLFGGLLLLAPEAVRQGIRTGLELVKVKVADERAAMTITFFN